ncbi:MAG TPA: hypothetical protein GXX51_05715 [Firmicutes bacterium]|nr:hypothetical protein [Bacillota bacterium]
MIHKYGDWDKAIRIFTGLDLKYRQAIKRALNRVGVYVRDKIKRGIRDQAPGGREFSPLSELTIRRKGSSKALIETGDFIGAVTFKVVGGDAVFVGLLRSARGKDGQSLVNIGEVHEFGCVIPVTPKMRGFFRGVFGVNLKPSTTAIRIPPRPYLRPVLEAEADNVIRIFQEELAKLFKV